MGLVLPEASDYSEAMTLAKAAKILRRHMLDHKSKFNGTFHEGCIGEAIPTTLLQFVGMAKHGADIKSQLKFGASQLHSCCGTTAMQDTKKGQQLTDTRKIGKHHSLST